MSDFHDESDLWTDGLPEDADDDLDELDGPPVEFRRGRRSRYKFVITPQWVLLMTELSHPAFRLYSLMLAHVSSERDDMLVWPHQKTLAKMMGYSRKASVPPLVKLLVKLELVEVEEKRYGHNNSRRRNVYIVHEEPPANWEGWASLQEFYAAEKAQRKAARAAEKKAAAEATAKARKPHGSAGQGQDAPAPSPEHGKSGEAAPAARGHDEPGAPASSVGAKPPQKKAAGKKLGKSRVRMTREQAAAVAAVAAAWPAELAGLLPTYRPDVIRDAVLDALAHGRTADQLVARVQRRWSAHGYADALLAHDGKGIGSPVGVAVALVRPPAECPDPMCEDGVLLPLESACVKCEQRRLDHRADRRQRQVPGPREDRRPRGWTCENPDCRKPGRGEAPKDGVCGECRQKVQQSAALLSEQLAAEETARQRAADADSYALLLEEAYAEYRFREDEVLAAAEREQQRKADAAESRRIREELLREHPELAQYAQVQA
ncbi:hypothetical protein ACFWJY_00630 [Streptomyces anulatus]|uniref:hypothetical protein n=1 Tax=Streptomyces anulatus TaxID=1892 RepID=UPI00364AB473